MFETKYGLDVYNDKGQNITIEVRYNGKFSS